MRGIARKGEAMNKTDILLPCPFCGGEEEILSGHERDIPPYFYGRCKMCGSRSETKFSKEEAITACNRRYEQPNEPLTIEKIKHMEGEPVYIEDLENDGETSCWAIVGKYDADGIDLIDKYCDKNYVDYGSFNLYGKTWLAYKRKPERKEK